MATHVGERWGNYQLVQLLGEGGFAEVYLGEHVLLGMRSAIKILHSRLAGDDITAFQREARTIAELAHPHIIRVLDFDVQQGVPFLVLDYAPNGSLRHLHPSRKRVPLEQVVDYVRQVASALQYAHEHRLIHRDVKPENMLLNTQGQVVLTDFGIATLAHSTSSMRTQDTTGTLAYMAPEQIQGKPRPASDQYALAVTVYQWLTGSLPFQGSASELMAQHLAATPSSMRNKAPDISPEVDQVTLKALRKNPQERFDGVEAFADALSLASSSTPQAVSPPLPQQPAPALDLAAATLPTQAVSTVAETPLPRGLVPAGSTTRPGSPLSHKPAPPRPRRRARGWIIACLLLALIGGIVAVAIAAIPKQPSNITSCAVGSDYNLFTGKVVGESTHFSAGVTVTLVCQLAPGSFPSLITDESSWSNGDSFGTDGTEMGFGDPTHNAYYNYLSVGAGSYTWNVYYNGTQEISLNFQVT